MIDVAILVGMILGAPLGIFAVALFGPGSDADDQVDAYLAMLEGDELAAWGGQYPRIETTAANEAAPTPSRR